MSKLETISKQYRDALIVKNDYNNNDYYNVSHKDALSDGDELGKGENGGNVGSLTDIKTRDKLVVKNIYNKNKEYNAGTA